MGSLQDSSSTLELITSVIRTGVLNNRTYGNKRSKSTLYGKREREREEPNVIYSAESSE